MASFNQLQTSITANLKETAKRTYRGLAQAFAPANFSYALAA